MQIKLRPPYDAELKLGDITLAYQRWGETDKPAAIALHGWLDNSASFSLLAQNLPQLQMVAPDLAGHGRSGHRSPRMPYYVWENVVEVMALADALALEQFDLIGHSMGAGIALMVAAMYPERVRRLVFLEGLAPIGYTPDQLPQSMRTALERRQRLQQRSGRGYPDQQSMIKARMQGRWPVGEAAAKLLVERGSYQSGGRWFWSSDRALMAPAPVRLSPDQVRGFMHQVQAPRMLAVGEQGIDKSHWQPWLEDLPMQALYTLPGGHHNHTEQAVVPELAKLITEFLVNPEEDMQTCDT